ncbi:MAG: 23S rRNA (pseudouridine(1915)-N(3))-methyltransferase RlmH [Bryobacterales bacterium]|nr:23S rRNA (pseudouridine(1915)-N(3))-methyltransferase RlmH [Acidobacteriota bacterium]MCB9383374.1 23S rRNA (pseudouridine(1915)-N(3))-methyltransferase RlmH [Bryobacterales bacterium]
MKVDLYYIGKPRSRALNEAAAEYAKRLGRYCRFSIREIKSEKDAPETKALRVALDPRGEQMDSAGLAAFLEGAGRDVAFYIGGAEGWTDEFRQGADRLLSLSKMTLPHELARVVLAEQIYRAFTILSGHPYNK